MSPTTKRLSAVEAFLFPLVLLLLFYVLLIRPAQRRQKAQVNLQSSLVAGRQVMLTSGVFGTLTDVSDPDRASVEIAPGVVIEVARAAVASMIDEPGDDVIDDAPAADDKVVLDKRDDEGV